MRYRIYSGPVSHKGSSRLTFVVITTKGQCQVSEKFEVNCVI